LSLDLDMHLPAIGAGDPESFALWMAGAEPPLRRALRRFAADLDTEAVLQETLLRVWQVARRVEPDGRPNALLRFAHRVARNLALSMLRAAREIPDGDAGADLADEPRAPDPLLRRALAACRERLPRRPAQALDARLDASGAEPDAALARRLGMTTNTFLQNFTRARKLLADCLRARGVELP
jgi:RNA polymerase sigma-70 factor (ECF subfamily)